MGISFLTVNMTLRYLNLLVNLILNQHFQNQRCVLLLTDQKTTISTIGSNIPIVILRNENATFLYELLFSNYGCQGIVIHVEKPSLVFSELEKQIRLHLDRFNQRRYLILPTEKGSECVMDFLKTSYVNYVADILLIVFEGASKRMHPNMKHRIIEVVDEFYYFYTHRYIGKENTNLPVLKQQWSSNNSQITKLQSMYPDKLSNQMGRNLKIATFTYLPYSIPKAPDGIEMRVALEYARKHNMSVKLVVNEQEEWGDIYANWTGTGIVGNLIFDKGDMGFGALYTWEEHYHFLDLSKPLVRTGITCLVPAPRLSAGWFVPLFSFSNSTWIGIGISFIASVFVLFTFTLVKRSAHSGYTDNILRTFVTVFLRTTACFLIQSLPHRSMPTRDVMKFVMGTIFLSSLLLTSCYNSGLASSMTIPRYDDPINTVEDLVAANIHWGATSTAWITSIENAEEELYQQLVSNFIIATKEQLYKYAMGSKKFAFSIERLPFGHYAIGNYIREHNVAKFRPMTTDIYWEQCVIMTKKSSILLPSLDLLILRIAESGIPDFWENEVSMLYSDANVQQAVKYYAHHHEKEVIRLEMKHLEGAFAVLVIGSILACICFVLEIIVHVYSAKTLPFQL